MPQKNIRSRQLDHFESSLVSAWGKGHPNKHPITQSCQLHLPEQWDGQRSTLERRVRRRQAMHHYNTTENVTSKTALVAHPHIPWTDDTAERPWINTYVWTTCTSIQKWMVPTLWLNWLVSPAVVKHSFMPATSLTRDTAFNNSSSKSHSTCQQRKESQTRGDIWKEKRPSRAAGPQTERLNVLKF